MYLENLAAIERIAGFVARSWRLNADESAEFVQVVRVRVFLDDYAILRKFKGNSSLTTYLTTVILRIFHQCRVEAWGKWRPSAEAKRLGPKAIRLERLLSRDGYTFAEAVQTLTTGQAQYTLAELEALYLRLPKRTPRPVLVSDDAFPDVVSVESDADDRVEAGDRERTARRAVQVLDATLATFDAEDRLILQLRFWDARKVPDIAGAMGLEQKKVYKRLEKLFTILRRALESAGLDRTIIDKLLGRPDQEIRLDILAGGENPPFRPSHPTGEEVRGGEGRLP